MYMYKGGGNVILTLNRTDIIILCTLHLLHDVIVIVVLWKQLNGFPLHGCGPGLGVCTHMHMQVLIRCFT